jgi:hypothetical protein
VRPPFAVLISVLTLAGGCASRPPSQAASPQRLMAVEAVVYTTRLTNDPLATGGALSREQARRLPAHLREEEQRGTVTILSRPTIALLEAEEGVVEIGSVTKQGAEGGRRILLKVARRGGSLDCRVEVRSSGANSAAEGTFSSDEGAVSVLKCAQDQPTEGEGPIMVCIRRAGAG